MWAYGPTPPAPWGRSATPAPYGPSAGPSSPTRSPRWPRPRRRPCGPWALPTSPDPAYVRSPRANSEPSPDGVVPGAPYPPPDGWGAEGGPERERASIGLALARSGGP